MRLIDVAALSLALNVMVAFGASSGQAQLEKKPLVHESEASIVTVSGNTTAETYQAKQKTSYSIEASTLLATGSYLEGKSRSTDKTNGVVTEIKARKWDAALRYEFNFTELLGAYIGHGAESDPNAGYVQRDNSDIGGKYLAHKDENSQLQTELGYRYSKIYDGVNNEYVNFARLFVEYIHNLNKEVTFKIWLEHLPNLKDAERYLSNGEASVSVVLTSMFSLKSAYRAKYHNFPLSTPFLEDRRLDSTFTTALVAKF